MGAAASVCQRLPQAPEHRGAIAGQALPCMQASTEGWRRASLSISEGASRVCEK